MKMADQQIIMQVSADKGYCRGKNSCLRWNVGEQECIMASVLRPEMRGGTANCNVIISDDVIVLRF